MANEKNHAYTSIPVLSKVKIGDAYYYLKDAEARSVIDSILNDYLTSEDKTEGMTAFLEKRPANFQKK